MRVRDGESWTYNDGPGDPPGPDDPGWLPFLGDYTLVTRDGLRARIPVTNRNGYLYIAGQRIAERANNRFTPRGEHVELDGNYIRVGQPNVETHRRRRRGRRPELIRHTCTVARNAVTAKPAAAASPRGDRRRGPRSEPSR